VSPVKLQHRRKLDGIKKPAPNIAHQEKVHAQAEQVKNNNKDHKNVIDQKQLEELAVRIDIVIFRVVS